MDLIPRLHDCRIDPIEHEMTHCSVTVERISSERVHKNMTCTISMRLYITIMHDVMISLLYIVNRCC